ncbi:MAG: HesA/MoeB/ThiF family protein [Candidatus Hodarchaeales archaeon]|jgi:molybdopterin/thiamine biosynthesis adenylyltransferase
MSDNTDNFTSTSLTTEEKKLFDRQLRLPGWNQELLKNSSVLIAGIGGLGVEVAKNLTMAGVGHLILVDLDTIEFSNFNRQILFVGAKEGSYKAETAAKKLKEINPYIRIDHYNSALEDLDPVIYQEVDLYVSGLDSINARIELNRRSVHNRKPLIDAGTAAYNGHLYCIIPYNNACLDCDPLQERDLDELGACTLVGNPRKPVHCVLQAKLQFEENYKREPDVYKDSDLKFLVNDANKRLINHFPNEKAFSGDQIVQLVDNHEPTVITINAVMASLQSQEVIKMLHNLKSSDHNKMGTLQLKYIIYNGLTGKFYEIEKPRNPNCALCGRNKIPLFKIKVSNTITLQQIIAKFAEKKNYKIDLEMPPNVFKIDSSTGMEELDLNISIKELDIRNFETILVMGFEEEESIYIQFKM